MDDIWNPLFNSGLPSEQFISIKLEPDSDIAVEFQAGDKLFPETSDVFPDLNFILHAGDYDMNDTLRIPSHVKEIPHHHRWLGHSSRPGREGSKGKPDRKNMWSKKK
jgi:hypothetical protein